jgi:hypothetical protein
MSTIGTGTRTVKCKYCDTVECFWARFDTSVARAKETGEPAPLNLVEAKPRDDGDLVVVRWSGGVAVVHTLGEDEIARGVDESRYRRHRGNCPGRAAGGGAR